jgi:hypothetical protein
MPVVDNLAPGEEPHRGGARLPIDLDADDQQVLGPRGILGGEETGTIDRRDIVATEELPVPRRSDLAGLDRVVGSIWIGEIDRGGSYHQVDVTRCRGDRFGT